MTSNYAPGSTPTDYEAWSSRERPEPTQTRDEMAYELSCLIMGLPNLIAFLEREPDNEHLRNFLKWDRERIAQLEEQLDPEA